MLSFMLLFNTTVVYADIGGDIPTPFPTLIPTFPDPGEFFIRLLLPDGGQAADYISEWLKKRWSTDEDKNKDMSSDGNTVTFNSNFVNELNTALQDKVHALDGYYLVEPDYPYDFTAIKKFIKDTDIKDIDKFSELYYGKFENKFDSNDILIVEKDSSWGQGYCFSNLTGLYPTFRTGYVQQTYFYNPETKNYLEYLGAFQHWRGNELYGTTSQYDKCYFKLDLLKNGGYVFFYNSPIKVFYSEKDLMNYLNNGKQRTYVPQLPSGGFKVNIKYINNTTNLPDITYNINTTNKTETEIQNQYDTTINNYINNLNDFTDGGGGTTNPTPTPSGGGSDGDFGDGTTPTPKPDFTDGSLTDTNTLLQKILDKLTEFSANHDKLAKTITDYIEKNNGKLEEILLAIQALSDGKTETEQNGCKYDFTALSKYLTDLWNNSDKKFDEMVKPTKACRFPKRNKSPAYS